MADTAQTIAEKGEAAYRAVSAWAVVGLLLGVASPLALVAASLAVVPLSATVVSIVALWRINRRRTLLAGQRLAWAGMALGVLFTAASWTNWAVYRWGVRQEACRFAQLWFQLLADDQPQMAHQLTRHPKFRPPLDETLWKYYLRSQERRSELEHYVAQPLVRTLLALGENSHVRYYDLAAHYEVGETHFVSPIFAVMFDEQDGKKTFFVQLQLERVRLESGKAGWRVAAAEGGVRPAGF